jgi:hypothetical protein
MEERGLIAFLKRLECIYISEDLSSEVMGGISIFLRPCNNPCTI